MKIKNLQHFKQTQLFVKPNNFEGIRSIFEVHILNMKKSKECSIIDENIASITLLDHMLVMTIHSVDDLGACVNVNEDLIRNVFKETPDITLLIIDRTGEVIEATAFKHCTLLDVSSLTYDYSYAADGLKIMTVVVKYETVSK